jgi:hypothetical protein
MHTGERQGNRNNTRPSPGEYEGGVRPRPLQALSMGLYCKNVSEGEARGTNGMVNMQEESVERVPLLWSLCAPIAD